MNPKDEINMYFKKFLLTNQYSSFNDEFELSTFEDIAKQEVPAFDIDWNYLMLLVSTIEEVYNVTRIELSHNYFRFEFGDEPAEQDKGMTLIDAVYRVCHKTLERFWKEPAPHFERGGEPFDDIDLA